MRYDALRLRSDNKAALHSNVAAQLNVAADSQQTLVESKVLGHVDFVIGEQSQLKVVHLTINLLASQIAVDNVMDGKTAVLDNARVGVACVGSDFVYGLLVAAANVAKGDKVSLGNLQDSCADNALVAAVGQSDLAQELFVKRGSGQGDVQLGSQQLFGDAGQPARFR